MTPIDPVEFKERESEVRRKIADARSLASQISRRHDGKKEIGSNPFGRVTYLGTGEVVPPNQRSVNWLICLNGFAAGSCFALAFLTLPNTIWTSVVSLSGIGFAYFAYRILDNQLKQKNKNISSVPTHKGLNIPPSCVSADNPMESVKESVYLEMETIS